MSELTFSIIKPDAVAAGQTGSILQMIIDAAFEKPPFDADVPMLVPPRQPGPLEPT